ncbi:hypothetical protein RO3G_06219 [Rhizopus delemar RA 99-880]|uniref:Uncharacterized protein n=1 Tax=Rhizopus delemar (strain RA 99-880 / ATCC MYA-4621 / FGSC 9543 / NRRL 43880) TaxID=246409 RepID=I1BZ84_RHIO9|nr:hypothetical protein RO3G_06219 [Rhizopus delemar RA 99-880]|eukprot:EIE81514.1 hypothetical protein RO3G_06219 [Rhizopus delemar RA 99-880]
MTDGLIKLYDLKQLEILLLGTSGSFGNTDMVKIYFDHHKGTFRCLAMLKVLADEFFYASEEIFKKLKIFFLHASAHVPLTLSLHGLFNGQSSVLYFMSLTTCFMIRINRHRHSN